jgi:hypothetical protein
VSTVRARNELNERSGESALPLAIEPHELGVPQLAC